MAPSNPPAACNIPPGIGSRQLARGCGARLPIPRDRLCEIGMIEVGRYDLVSHEGLMDPQSFNPDKIGSRCVGIGV